MIRTSFRPAVLIAVMIVSSIMALIPVRCSAGMPFPLVDDVSTILRLDEEPKQRLQVISFFLLTFLFSALMVKWLWNGLRAEFSILPRISFNYALLVTFAWGLLFCIVLVMISGARELMTPGAWEKKGATYQLKSIESEEVSYER